jgi:hypothetical protein
LAGRRRSQIKIPALTATPRPMKTQRCQPPALLKKLNAAPSLCSRMISRTGSKTTLSNSSNRSTINAFVH